MQPRKSGKNDRLAEEAAVQQVLPGLDETDARQRILAFLTRIPASFIGEISWECNQSDYLAKAVLLGLWRDEMVERLKVSYDYPDPRLLLRVPDMSAKNQAGYNNFSKKRWFAITKKGRSMI